MQNFICKAITPQGQVVKIKMCEENKISCLKKLKKNGMTPVDVRKSIFSNIKKNNTAKVVDKNKELVLFNSNKIEISDIKRFTQDLYLLKKSKFSNKEAMRTILKNSNNEVFKKVLLDINKDVERGDNIYEAMEKHYEVFPIVYVNMLKAGEVNNSMEDALKNAIDYLESEENIKNKINNVIIPNVILFFAVIILTVISINIGVPALENIFKVNGVEVTIPKTTLFLMDVINLFIRYWYVWFIALIVAIFLGYKYIKTPKGKYKFDHFKYTNPIFGKLIYLVDFSRIVRSGYISLKNKTRLQDALEVSKTVEKNTYMINRLEESINCVYQGKPWIEPFEKDKILNGIIIEMLRKTNKNNMVEILEKINDYLDFEIDNQIKRAVKLLPMISYGFVGIAILIFSIVILVPCIQVFLGGMLFI